MSEIENKAQKWYSSHLNRDKTQKLTFSITSSNNSNNITVTFLGVTVAL